MIFENRRYFTKQIFEIKKSGLNVEIKSLFDSVEYEISHEQIDNKKKVQISINHGLLITGIFFFVFGVLFLLGTNDELTGVFVSISLLCAALAFISRKKVVIISLYDGNKIQLYFTKQNRQGVIDFANQIIEASNKYLLTKYGRIDPALPTDPQIQNIQFLRNREIISEEDYESLKNQLLGRNNKSSIGFGK